MSETTRPEPRFVEPGELHYAGDEIEDRATMTSFTIDLPIAWSAEEEALEAFTSTYVDDDEESIAGMTQELVEAIERNQREQLAHLIEQRNRAGVTVSEILMLLAAAVVLGVWAWVWYMIGLTS